MRMFWHPALIPLMPDPTIQRLFRYACDMRESWRVPGSDNPYLVNRGAYEQLLAYWSIVACEMNKRGLDWDLLWSDLEYRGTHEAFHGIRVDYLAIYFERDNPYPNFHTEERLRSQILWLRNRGKATSKILKALKQEGFNGLESFF